MGATRSRAEVVRGLEPLSVFDVTQIRGVFHNFEDVSSLPALWERSFDELLGCFKTPASASKAFRVLDTDQNGFLDARETIGSLAILSRGHLADRMTLLFDVFDLNKGKEMTLDACFLMLQRTLAGLRKLVNILVPPDKVILNMAKQIWKQARKPQDAQISERDWFNWWSSDASCRNGLKMFAWRPEDQRGLPKEEKYINIDYAKGMVEVDAERLAPPGSASNSRNASKGSPSLLPPGEPGSAGSRRSSERESSGGLVADMLPMPMIRNNRKASFSCAVDKAGVVSAPVQCDSSGEAVGLPELTVLEAMAAAGGGRRGSAGPWGSSGLAAPKKKESIARRDEARRRSSPQTGKMSVVPADEELQRRRSFN